MSSVSHHPSSPPSTKALNMLRAAVSGPFPNKDSPPLEYNLEVIDGNSDERPQTVEGIIKLAQKNPKALRWPIVVDWIDGKAATILEHLRKKRDGEAGEENLHKPGWFT
ncbi:hypothetical protein BKA70DRAFT_1372230 [Coprinopsis sp. MPI-PUGE-AT-0042]|nr:hypothetical protein BKA70DRAFT_1372230 [Coprinopsis sp. MPI-PUGE-AT-0042]